MGSTWNDAAVQDFRSFEISGPEHGITEDLVLLSWLIVLLRTREDGQASFDWRYSSDNEGAQQRVISSERVMTGLDSKAEDVATVIRQGTTKQSPRSNPTTILLSTGRLSHVAEGTKDEGVVHLQVNFNSNNNNLGIRPVYRSPSVLDYTAKRYIESLADTIQLCVSNPGSTIEECLRPTTHDLDTIWSWNRECPPTYDFCMQDMISEVAQRYPEKVAIDSWDGQLTYGNIDRWSTYLAGTLRDSGVQLHDFVPLCFEKSRWTIVAVLAVMKAGATIVMMDPTLPLARLQNMGTQVGAQTVVSSRMQHDLAREILPEGKHFTVDEQIFAHLSPSDPLPTLPSVPASALMYIIFTSGSTGTPKGVKISHSTYTSSAIPRAAAVGYTPESRVLDFASYAFDVSIDSMLLTLSNGGCLCIPSDDDRLNDINGVIRRMKVNYAGITPSVARILDQEVIASLHGLGLGGEAVSARDANLWGQDTRIIIGYGPCECTIGCTVNSSAATGRDYISIGPGNGACMWIVNPDDHEQLMPVGAVGELLVEGPIVGQGYLNDEEKTAAAFIEDPKWLVNGHKAFAGRRGRLYKTGDLGRWDPAGNGEIVFVGRKDTQVKLRGQRVELGEIESQLKDRLPSNCNVIAEVIKHENQLTLVAFISQDEVKSAEIEVVEPSDELRGILSKIDAELGEVLPRYMVPTSYITVNYIPTLISGKTDRKRLRTFGATVDLRQVALDQDPAAGTRELTELEQRLRQAWGAALNLDPEGIRPDNNFFALGGDSLAAMKLIPICRERGLELSVTKTFDHPTLSGMANVVLICDVDVKTITPAFSMISTPVQEACKAAARACGTNASAVEDIYPCTATQESLFTFSLKSKEVYVAQRLAVIPSDITVEAWKAAWETVVAATPILRTRCVQIEDPGLQQVVLKETIAWHHSANLHEYMESDRTQRMNLGEPLARYAIIEDNASNETYMVWTIHHVLYDGWSEPQILDNVAKALHHKPLDAKTEIKEFVNWNRSIDQSTLQTFWRRELKGAVGPQFPRLPSRDYLPTPDGFVEREISLESGTSRLPFTTATLIRGAWALVASQYTASDDVVFGETLTGRDISLPGVETVIGPLNATVPIRIRIDRASSVTTYLQSVQQAILSRSEYQHMGMQNIRKVSVDAQHACEAGTGLVIQPESEYNGSLGFKTEDVVREALHFNPYPCMIACGLRKGGFRVCASFDTGLIEERHMERILGQLEKACGELVKNLQGSVGQVFCLPEQELNTIWGWNQVPPLSVDGSTKKLRADADLRTGSVYPRAVVPWVVDPRNPAMLSPIDCAGELWLETPLLFSGQAGTPAWLVSGSSAHQGRQGTVQSTGDMVQAKEDGTLIYVGRKEDVVPEEGHGADIAALEAQFAKHVAPSVRYAVALVQSASDSADQEQELAILIEAPTSKEDCAELLPSQQDITWTTLDGIDSTTTLCASIPISLAAALKKFDKHAHHSLASHMVPSVYVVVDKLPAKDGDVDHALLNQLAAQISRLLLDEIRDGFKEVCKQNLLQANLTPAETILRSAWAKILNMKPDQIDVDDNFFRLGGDSVLAMKLVSSLRAQGHGLTVADVFQHMRLGDAAKVLKVDVAASKAKVDPIQPFSTLNLASSSDVEIFLSEVVRPQLTDPSWSIQDVLPITDSQTLDVRATVDAPRTSIQYTMLYFNQGTIYRKNLLRACNELVKTHEILRTVFIKHKASYLQVVLSDLIASVSTLSTDQPLDEFVTDLCNKEIERNHPLGTPFTSIFHVSGPDGTEALVLGLSHAQYDGVSLPRLLRDLETLYTGGQVTDYAPFSTYISQTRKPEIQSQAVGYWSCLLKDSTLSILPEPSLRSTSGVRDRAIFLAHPVRVSKGLEHITKATLVTTAWALVLSSRLHTTDLVFGSVTSGRQLPSLFDADNIVGPCYQFTPVRVRLPSSLSRSGLSDLMASIQRQTAASSAHDHLGFSAISNAVGWEVVEQEEMFDSVVHHQDHDDFDTMPFAGGECRVDIANPHGDAAWPLKVVSYVKRVEGREELVVGIVGAEKAKSVVEGLLGELVGAVERLSCE